MNEGASPEEFWRHFRGHSNDEKLIRKEGRGRAPIQSFLPREADSTGISVFATQSTTIERICEELNPNRFPMKLAFFRFLNRLAQAEGVDAKLDEPPLGHYLLPALHSGLHDAAQEDLADRLSRLATLVGIYKSGSGELLKDAEDVFAPN